MGRRLGRIEERVRAPHVVDVLNPEVRVLEQVCGLGVDLERIVVIEQVDVERLRHTPSVYYTRRPNPLCRAGDPGCSPVKENETSSEQ